MTKADVIMRRAREALASDIDTAVVAWARQHAPNAPIGEVFALASQLSGMVATPLWEAYQTGQNAKAINTAE